MNLRGEDGQSLVFVTIALVIILGMLGLVLDTGKVYIVQRQLQTATDAAALAAAQDLPDATAAAATACSYGATDGNATGSDGCAGDTTRGANVASLSGVSTQIQPECLSTQTTGINCFVTPSCPSGKAQPPDGNVGCNAIEVTETVKVRPWLLGILGIGDQTVSSTSTASMAGGSSTPLDLVMINDTTESMQTSDTCGGTVPTDVPASQLNNLTQEDCAKAGIRALLTNLDPCVATLTTCDPQSGAGSDQIASANQLDDVAMFTFPGLKSGFVSAGDGDVGDELDCTGEINNTNTSYGTGPNGTGATFQIVPFSTDYRYSDTPTSDPLATLYPNSSLVRSVYWPGDGCPNGGYPINGGGGGHGGGGGGSSSSIAGGTVADSITANNNTPAIGGGAATGANSGNTVNSGIVQGVTQPSTTTGGVAVGQSTKTSTTGLAIGGGTNGTGNTRGNNAANASTLGIQPPANTGTNDLVMVTVTAQDPAITASSSICPPAGGGWTLLDKTASVGTTGTTPVMEAIYWGVRSAVGGGTGFPAEWRFTFATGGCGSASLTADASSILAVRFSNAAGIDVTGQANTGGPANIAFAGSAPSTPFASATNFAGTAPSTPFASTANFAGSAPSTAFASNTNFAGSAPSTTWNATGTTYSSAIASKTWSSGNWYTSVSANCALQTAGSCNTTTAAGTITSASFSFGSAIGATSAYSVTLYKNGVSTGSSCPITGGGKACTIGGLNVAVTGANTIVLVVSRTSGGGTSYTGSGAGGAVDTTGGNNTHYVSLSTACASTSAATCNVTTVAATGTLTSATLTFGTAVPAGDALTVTLFQNGASSGSTCTIAAGASTCTISPALAVTAGNTLELQAVTAGTVAFTATATSAAVESGAAPTYVSLSTACASASVATCDGATVAVTGTLTSATLTFGANVPAGDTFVVTLFQNAAATGSTCTVAAGASSCTIAGGLALATGDKLELQVTRSLGTAAFTATATSAAVESGAAPTYISLSTACASASVATCDGATVAKAGTITSASLALGLSVPAGDTFTVTLFRNGATTGSSCTITATNTTCSISPALAVAAGDTLELQVTRTAGAAAFTATATTSAVESVSTPEYVSLSSACASTSSTTCNVTTVPAPGGTLTSATLTFGSPVPTGDTFTVTLYRNGATTGLSCAINANGTTCTINAGSAINTGDTLELQVTRTAGTAAFTATATTSAAGTGGNGTALTAPPVTTNFASDDVVRLFSTGSTFVTGSGLATASGSGTSTGADDAIQAAAGPSGIETVNTNTSDNWVAETIALKPALPTSIAITLPGGYTGSGTNLLLTTIAVQSLGSGNVICAPTGWTAVSTQQKGALISSPDATGVTQESFWTMSTNPGLIFNFEPSGCSGTAVQAAASEVTQNYTGVDSTNPFEPSPANPQGATGATTTISPLSVTTVSTGDEVVGLVASDGTSITGLGPAGNWTIQNGSNTSVGVNSQLASTAGSVVTPATAMSTPANSPWAAETVALRPALPTSITVAYPNDYAGDTGDALLVSISAQGAFGNTTTAGTCTTAANWNLLKTTYSGSGATELVQSVWWTTLNTANPGQAVFSFSTNVNTTTFACSGSPVNAGASDLATTYTGVDVATAPLVSATTVPGATGKALTAPNRQTVTSNNEIVSFFASNDDFIGTVPTQHTPHNAWANGGEDAVSQAVAGNQPTPPGPAQAATGNSANWTAETIALAPLIPSSITISPPDNYDAGGGDLMLVTIAVQGLGTGTICAPDTTWNKVPVPTGFTVTSGGLTQESFWTMTSGDDTDTFTFNTGTTCAGVPVPAVASAVAVVYTGIDPTNPIDGNAVPASGAASPLKAAAGGGSAGDVSVALYGSNAASLTGPCAVSTGGDTTSGVSDSLSGTTCLPTANVTSSPTNANWTAETVSLTPLGSNGITIQRPGTPTSNDFVLVDLTVKGLPSGASICAPNDATWPWVQEGATITQQTAPNPRTSQALFYSTRTSLDLESYTFTFRTGACPSGGVATSAAASAIAVRYTGVNPITPIDNNGAVPKIDVYGSAQGNSKSVVPPTGPPGLPLGPVHTGDAIVAFYGAASTTSIGISAGTGHVTGQSQGSSTTTAFWDSGTSTVATGSTLNPAPPAGTLGTTSDWVTQSLALEAAASTCGTCVYGAEDPGGVGTDYGIAINAAENALDTEAGQLGRASAQKVIVILSDGDANTNDNHVTNTPCQFGITAAEAAEAASDQPNTAPGNTWIFSVAYGANYDQTGHATPKSCTLDATSGNLAGLSAQCAMQLMADNHVTDTRFASDPTDRLAKSTICGSNAAEPSDPSHRFYNEAVNSSLEAVFTQIAEQATQARLVSNSAT